MLNKKDTLSSFKGVANCRGGIIYSSPQLVEQCGLGFVRKEFFIREHRFAAEANVQQEDVK